VDRKIILKKRHGRNFRAGLVKKKKNAERNPLEGPIPTARLRGGAMFCGPRKPWRRGQKKKIFSVRPKEIKGGEKNWESSAGMEVKRTYPRRRIQKKKRGRAKKLSRD